jgi:chemotaxis protein methyltransferase CheR
MSSFASDDYLGFCEGLRQICGIDLTQYKREQMERRLRTFFERKGIKRLTDSLSSLKADKAELDALIDRMTINVSQLWRNPEQWQLVERMILPELGRAGRPIQAWSAGSSYGAELFTLAAVCCDARPPVKARLLGTDIDPRMVARAREGCFDDADARDAPRAQLERWFEREDGGWQARSELRGMTTFEVGDLLRLRPRSSYFDLILCRNTVIYFAEPIRDQLHRRLAAALRPGGYLMVGSTERVADPASIGLKPVHPFIFRKS